MLPNLSLPNMNFTPDLGLLIFIGVAAILVGIGLYFFWLMNKLHPEVVFMSYGKTGAATRKFRTYAGKIVTDMSIWVMLLGQTPQGLHIKRFSYDFFDGKKKYLCQYIDGRIYPIPFNFGSTPMTIFKCNKCGFSDIMVKNYVKHGGKLLCPTVAPMELQKLDLGIDNMFSFVRSVSLSEMLQDWQDAILKKRDEVCSGEMIEEEYMMDNMDLHALKFTAELEKRFVYTYQSQEEKLGRIPLKDLVIAYDVGKEIASDMTQGIRESQTMIEKNNPLMSILIMIAPLGALMILSGFIAYVTYTGISQGLTEASGNTLQIAKILALLKGVNVTGLIIGV